MGVSREQFADIFKIAGIIVGTAGNVVAPGVGAAAGAALGGVGNLLDRKEELSPEEMERELAEKAAKEKEKLDEKYAAKWFKYARKLEKEDDPPYPGEAKAALLDQIIGGDLALREGKMPTPEFIADRKMYIQTLRQMIAAMATIEEAD